MNRPKWLNASNLFGAIGIMLAIFFYLESREFRQPTYVVDPLSTVIVSESLNSNTGLSVVDSDGNVILGPLSSRTLYFWNDGKKPLRPDDVLAPITIVSDAGRILDAVPFRVSRDVVKPELTIIGEGEAVEIGFEILEQGDGVAVQLLYQGAADAKFTMTGVTIDAPKIRDSKNLTVPVYLTSIATVLVGFLLVITIGIALIHSFFMLSERAYSVSDEKDNTTTPGRQKWARRGLAAFSIIVVVLVLGGLFNLGYQSFESLNKAGLIDEVPAILIADKSS